MAEPNESNDADIEEIVSLTFKNYTDLQTRLLLLPLDDEVCKGAVISSYTEIDTETLKDDDEICENGDNTDELDHITKHYGGGENVVDGTNQLTKNELDFMIERESVSLESSSINKVDPEKKIEKTKFARDDDPGIFSSENSQAISNQAPTNATDMNVSMEKSKFITSERDADNGNFDEEKKIEQESNVHKEEKVHEDNVSVVSEDFEGAISVLDPDILMSSSQIGKKLVGYILHEIQGIQEDDWTNCDFSTILASCRDAPTPIILSFLPPTDQSSNDDDQDIQELEETQINDNREKSIQKHEISQRLSRWSSRMRSTTSLLAAGTASRVQFVAESAAEVASKAKDNAAKAAEAATRLKNPEVLHQIINEKLDIKKEITDCALYMQTNNGNLTKISEHNKKINITNSSLILCRQSEEIPMSPGYSCQWYRSLPRPKTISTSDASHDDNWVPILEATSFAFQPSSTEIGYQIKCVVCIDSTPIFSLPIENVIKADTSLFNAARQNVGQMGSGRGAIFGNLKGRGNAVGRHFNVKIEIANDTVQKNIVTKLSLFQVSGSTAEPLHDHDLEPIFNPSARASHADPKGFELIFTPPQNSLLSVLLTNNSLQLSTPNRISRESMLLSLGIANFRGRPSALTSSTILFVDNENCFTELKNSTTSSGEDVKKEKNLTNVSNQENNNSNDIDKKSYEALESDQMRFAKKLAAKEKVISELQRALHATDTQATQAEKKLADMMKSYQKIEIEYNQCLSQLKLAEKRQETQEDMMTRVKSDFSLCISDLNNEIKKHVESGQEFEKMIKALENEKAVMSAAIEARDSKLLKMEDLRLEIDDLTRNVEDSESVKTELAALKHENQQLREKLSEKETICEIRNAEMIEAKNKINSIQNKLDASESHYSFINTKLINTQSQNQKLKTERNKFKQKADSLSKEMSRICRNGRQINEIEQMIDNMESMQSEIKILKVSKQQALKDLEECRLDYGTLVRTHKMAGGDYNTAKILEQRVELEKVIENLTEYVQAKEMQIETMREVNKSLMDELNNAKHFTI